MGYNEISFPHLGIDLQIDPIAFTIGGFSISWYGILITIGVALAMLYGFSRMRSFGIDSDRAIDGIIAGFVGGLLGARIYYVAFHWAEYAGDWKRIVNFRGGGLAIYGGVIGALLLGGLVCKLRKVRLLPMLDVASLGFLIGQGIGRWGNFTNQEAFGCNTDGMLGMTGGRIQSFIQAHFSDGSVIADQPVHPCFFYESMWCLFGFLMLHLFSKKWRKFDGQIFLMYVVWYGAGRFWIEGLRTDSLYLGTLRVSQLVAAISVVVGIVLLLVCGSRVRRMGRDYQLYCNTNESRALLAQRDEAYEQEKTRRVTRRAARNAKAVMPTLVEDALEQSTHTTEQSEEHREDSNHGNNH